MNPVTSYNDPLLDFRLAYLRAIAKAWRSPSFMDELVSAKDIQPILHEHCGLNWRWNHLAIQLADSPDKRQQTRYEPAVTGGWIGNDDYFQIALPQKPDADPAVALSLYYEKFPQFAGPVTLLNSADAPASSPDVGGALPTGLGLPGAGQGSLLAFGGVVLRAIALFWAPSGFAQALRDSPEDASPVLSRWLGYNNPFNFRLRFDLDSNLKWGDQGWDWAPGGVPVKNILGLNFPQTPDADQDHAIALTSYNNTGEAYPFTC